MKFHEWKSERKLKGKVIMNNKWSFLLIACCLIIAFIYNYQSRNQRLEQVEVIKVKDGDTIVVKIGTLEKTVRIIGIDTPESVHPDSSKNTEEGIAASNYAKKVLLYGKKVYLEYGKESVDRYGRLLAYVWLRDVDVTSYKNFCKYNYGAIMMQNTYCDINYYLKHEKYRSWYKRVKEN